MKLGTVLRWIGPAGIGFGVFLVFSALSGLPIRIPFLSEGTTPDFEVISSGLILWALVMLLVGMAGLYARQGPGSAKVIESGGPGDERLKELEERLALEELLTSPVEPVESVESVESVIVEEPVEGR